MTAVTFVDLPTGQTVGKVSFDAVPAVGDFVTLDGRMLEVLKASHSCSGEWHISTTLYVRPASEQFVKFFPPVTRA